MTEEAFVLTPSGSTNPNWLEAFPGLPVDVIAKLRARRIRSVAGAVRAARQTPDRVEPIVRALPRMQLDSVLDREAAHLILMLQVAADAPVSGAAGGRSRRRPAD